MAGRIVRSRFEGDRYLRGGRCWAKITGRRGSWHVALGWRGDVQATRSHDCPNLRLAEIIAEGWINDHGF